jgi:hypothetical protein
VDTTRIPHDDHDDTVEAHSSGLERPHACTNGLVFLTYTAFDEEIGDEVERLDVVPCRRCQGSLPAGETS